MGKQRLLWANDARHYHLFVHEPPMTLTDARRPVDEVAGSGVTTFVYMVARSDGLFYPSKVGQQWPTGSTEDTARPFGLAGYWRLANNLESLAQRGLDPLQILIDAAHANGMEFIASLRVPCYLGVDSSVVVDESERGVMADPRVREAQLAILSELARDYNTDGVEIDLSCGPGGAATVLRPEDAEKEGPVLTEWVRSVATAVHDRPAGRGLLGARVYPTQAQNAALGMDVEGWLVEGLLDYVVPMLYVHFCLDACQDVRWATAAARRSTNGDPSVYGMLQPYLTPDGGGAMSYSQPEEIYPSQEHFAAASANLYQQGCDGVYSYLGRWPHDGSVYRMLSAVGRGAEPLREQNKRYRIDERDTGVVESLRKAGLPLLPWVLPLEIERADPSQRYAVPLMVADELAEAMVSERFPWVPLQYRLFTPELPWQSRGK